MAEQFVYTGIVAVALSAGETTVAGTDGADFASYETDASAAVRLQIARGGGRLAAFLNAVYDLGRAVQVDPIKPTLTTPGIKLLKLECDELL
jgi:hypothetical protein